MATVPFVSDVNTLVSYQISHEQLRGELAGHLHHIVAAMNMDNFVVRPQRKSVERFAKLDAWKTLDDDEEAKRFDLLVLRTQPPTTSDLAELERMLVEAGGSPEVIKLVTEQNHGLGIFIRSMVGLDRETAKQALSQFVAGGAATSSQIELIGLIVDELTANGVMDVSRLYQAPFTDINSLGP